ncbi:MAG: SIMPL domain-containing protein [Steroidobacteraceae bacterium]
MNRLAVGCTLLTLLATPTFAQTINPNSIQPETTLSITANGDVTRQPDIAYITAGVQNEAKTAKEAVAANARNMAGVMKALKAAGIADKDIQTSNFSLNPRYDYVKDNDNSGRQVLAGYTVSNQVTAKITKLDTVGATLDALVTSGGNTVNDIRFALDNDAPARDEARTKAMQAAVQRANLYATAAGYKVARIVSINETFQSYEPQPKAFMVRAMAAEAAPTPIASGELTFSANVTVLFELKK